MIFKTSSETETMAVASEFALTLDPFSIILLNGDLGMGKSVFSRAAIRTLMGQANLDVPSPTFTFVQTYEAPNGNIWHFDLYRLKSPEELYEIGWEDALGQGILLIEWPERMGYLMPKQAISVTITKEIDMASRQILIER